MDDAQLVEGLQNGSEEAFLTLLDQYQSRIFNAVYRVLGDAVECEDVVQEVFLKVVKSIHTFNRKSSLYTWLYRIAFNTAVDARKKFSPRKMISLHDENGASQEIRAKVKTPDHDPQRREMAELLRDAMEQLTDAHRTILMLREFEGLSYTQIAEVLGCSKGTVESRLYRARNRLREKMEKYF